MIYPLQKLSHNENDLLKKAVWCHSIFAFHVHKVLPEILVLHRQTMRIYQVRACTLLETRSQINYIVNKQ